MRDIPSSASAWSSQAEQGEAGWTWGGERMGCPGSGVVCTSVDGGLVHRSEVPLCAVMLAGKESHSFCSFINIFSGKST